MKRFVVLSTILLIFSFAATDGYCSDPDEEGHVAAIQERVFHRYHELNLGFGYIPDDDFYYLFPVSLGYVFNLNEHWAWEVVRGALLLSKEKDLKGDLERDFGVTPSYFSKPEYAVHSNFMYKFLYGKSVLGDSIVLNHETYGLLGGGMLVYENKFTDRDPETEFVPSLSFGLGEKIHL